MCSPHASVRYATSVRLCAPTASGQTPLCMSEGRLHSWPPEHSSPHTVGGVCDNVVQVVPFRRRFAQTMSEREGAHLPSSVAWLFMLGLYTATQLVLKSGKQWLWHS